MMLWFCIKSGSGHLPVLSPTPKSGERFAVRDVYVSNKPQTGSLFIPMIDKLLFKMQGCFYRVTRQVFLATFRLRS